MLDCKLACRHSYGSKCHAYTWTREASTRSKEILTTSGEIELPHHHPTEHFISYECSYSVPTCDSHLDAVIYILCYIKGTSSQGVLYENRGHTQIIGYCDANWVGSLADRHSTSRYCVFIKGNLIS